MTQLARAHPPLSGAPNAAADATPLSPEQQERVVAGQLTVIWGANDEQADKVARASEKQWQSIKAWFSNLF
ncbi:hypothetical protein J5J86_07890 [Aquabacter sp. L1I39]|uniref:hypothetical protein n=1 Tax=Aquabacter sp. L1I39 TaxID=2820278 RepID=UPI001ADD2EDA|nr:hypothetical protein [Aquabacter sp. L1I39]QTL05200.1 hypothetical protein J5J86_07890 [Aquabacter sp. L1I39]